MISALLWPLNPRMGLGALTYFLTKAVTTVPAQSLALFPSRARRRA